MFENGYETSIILYQVDYEAGKDMNLHAQILVCKSRVKRDKLNSCFFGFQHSVLGYYCLFLHSSILKFFAYENTSSKNACHHFL